METPQEEPRTSVKCFRGKHRGLIGVK